MSALTAATLVLIGLQLAAATAQLSTDQQAFSVRAQLERYQDGRLLGAVRTRERYSARAEGRASLELLGAQGPAHQFHHVAGLWLRLADHQCQPSNVSELSLALFGPDPPSPLGELPRDRVAGAARLFAFVQQLKRRFFRPELSSIRGLTVAVFKLNLANDQRVNVYYNHLLLRDIMQPDTLPLQVELIQQQANSTRLYLIGLHEFKWLQVSLDQQVDASPTLLPLSVGCAAVLARAAPHAHRHPLLEAMLARATFSFGAKLVEAEQAADQLQTYSFNLDARLVRRSSNSQATHSATIYDFGRARSYHWRRDANADCFLAESRLPPADHKLADFERLQFMGRAYVDGVLADIFEHDKPDRLPFWLFPSLEVADATTNSSLVLGNQTPAGSQVSLVYYFAQDKAQLIRIDVQVRDPLRNQVLLERKLQVSSFESSANISGFSLADLCPSKSLGASQLLHLEALLEPVATGTAAGDAGDLATQVSNRNERNRLIARALELKLGISRLKMVGLSSRRVRDGQAPKQVFPPINIDLKISRVRSPRASWIRLGRGHFLSPATLLRHPASLGLESCAWLAAWYTQRWADQVAFSLSKASSECLLTKLYQPQARDPSANRTLNIYPYQFGEHEMLSVKLSSAKPLATDWPLLQTLKPFNLIGKRITLQSSGNKTIQYSVKHSTLKGDLAMSSRLQLNTKSIDQVAWYPASSRLLVKQVFAENDGESGRDLLMTRSLCHSMCLLDIQCRSYSYCERSASKPAECHLSKVSLESDNVLSQISAHLDDCSARKRCNKRADRPKLIRLQSSNSEVAVVADSRCLIQAKSYEELFSRAFASQLSLEQHQVLQVQSRGECARRCFERNLIYLKGAIRHKLNLTQVHLELVQMIDQEEDLPAHLESLFDWHKQNLKSLCVSYQFAQDFGSELDSGGGGFPCILSDHSSLVPSDMFAKPRANDTKVEMQNYKLNYLNLFQRTYGFQLIQGVESETPETLDALGKLRHLLASQQTGLNRQTRVNTDDVGYCARACILQTHGPKPSCSSFDFVMEHETGHRYCLLNSQSVHDLKRKSRFESQSRQVNNSRLAQYWHYEPQDSLLSPTDNLDDEDDGDELSSILLDSSTLLSRIASKLKPETDQANAFILPTLYLSIAALGLTSGILLGIVSAKWYDGRVDRDKTDDILIGNKVVRLVHRLSGVSICSQMLEREVRM